MWPLILIAVLTSLVMTLAEVGKARATVDLFTIDDQPVVLSAIEQNREEVWNWFNPGVVKGGLDENKYNFLGSWIRAGVGYEVDGVKGFAELMSPFFIICRTPRSLHRPKVFSAWAPTTISRTATRATPAYF